MNLSYAASFASCYSWNRTFFFEMAGARSLGVLKALTALVNGKPCVLLFPSDRYVWLPNLIRTFRQLRFFGMAL